MNAAAHYDIACQYKQLVVSILAFGLLSSGKSDKERVAVSSFE